MSNQTQLHHPQYQTEGISFYTNLPSPQHYPPHHHADLELILTLGQVPISVKWKSLENQTQTLILTKGHFCLIPANIHHEIYWQRSVECAIIFLKPMLLQRVAHDSISAFACEMTGQYGIQDSLIQSLVITLRSAFHADETWEPLYVDTLINTLLVHLLKCYAGCQFMTAEMQPVQSERWLQDVIDFIHESLDQDLRLTKLASIARMSESSFCHLFKEHMNISPHQYVIQARIGLAKKLLRTQNLPIADIAVCCGFNSQSHLTSYFRQHTGMTPKSFQRAN